MTSENLINGQWEPSVQIMNIGLAGVQGEVEGSSGVRLANDSEKEISVLRVMTHTVTPTEAVDAKALIASRAGVGFGPI